LAAVTESIKRRGGEELELVLVHAGFDGGELRLEFTGGDQFPVIGPSSYRIHVLSVAALSVVTYVYFNNFTDLYIL
jgi:hypothetical protein